MRVHAPMGEAGANFCSPQARTLARCAQNVWKQSARSSGLAMGAMGAPVVAIVIPLFLGQKTRAFGRFPRRHERSAPLGRTERRAPWVEARFQGRSVNPPPVRL